MSWRRRLVIAHFFGVGVLPLVAVVLVGVLAGAGGFTFSYGQGFAYLSSDPTGCKNCHVMQEAYDTWLVSSHHAVAVCNDCHLPHDFLGKWWTKADNGFFHSLAFTLDDFHEPLQIKPRNRRVTQGACIDCHRDTVDQMLPAHAARGEDDVPLCVGCHADVGHSGRRRTTTTFDFERD